jgi:hypothetical protein
VKFGTFGDAHGPELIAHLSFYSRGSLLGTVRMSVDQVRR